MSSFGETHWSFGEIITDCWAPRTPAGVIWWARAGSSMHFDTRLHRWRFRSKLNTKAWTWVIQWDVSMFKQFLTTPKKQRINPVVYDLTFTLISWPQLGLLILTFRTASTMELNPPRVSPIIHRDGPTTSAYWVHTPMIT
jgi:hypothetical protein